MEDAAHALRARDRGRCVGTLGDAAAFSFYATKNITTAEGGMLVVRDPAAAEQARILALHGISRDAWKPYTAAGHWRYEILANGYKYNLSDLAASLGLAQLRKLAAFPDRRRPLPPPAHRPTSHPPPPRPAPGPAPPPQPPPLPRPAAPARRALRPRPRASRRGRAAAG